MTQYNYPASAEAEEAEKDEAGDLAAKIVTRIRLDNAASYLRNARNRVDALDDRHLIAERELEPLLEYYVCQALYRALDIHDEDAWKLTLQVEKVLRNVDVLDEEAIKE